ncbi:MAG: hypothetical protein WKG00_33005 [Polyangiaceae bacterium]
MRALASLTRSVCGSALRATMLAALTVALASCDDAAGPLPRAGAGEGSAWEGELSAELRGFADVSLDGSADDAVAVRIEVRDVATDGLFDAAQPLVAIGRRERFPEAQSELYVATFAGVPASACPGGQATLALALHRRPPDARFAGGLTAYCGAEPKGTPARVFRLSGTLVPR